MFQDNFLTTNGQKANNVQVFGARATFKLVWSNSATDI